MQDKSLIEAFEWQAVAERITSDPITEKCLKVKQERIFHLNSTCEHEYLPDVRELYQWLFLFARHADFRTFITGDKLQRYFIEEFLPLAIKYLILSKKFKLAELMALTEQIILESLDLFVKMIGELDRYPKFVNVAILSLEHVRYFYKLNFQANYLHLLKEPTEEERYANFHFIEELKEGSLVDALKMDTFTGIMMWSRAMVTRVNTNVLAVSYLNDNRTSDRSMSKANMEIFPLKHYTQNNFEWRLELKAGDKVDYSVVANVWKLTTIMQVRKTEDDGQTVCMLGLNTIDPESLEWVTSTSVNIQPPRIFSTEEGDNEDLLTSKRNVQESKTKDYNDVLLTRGKFEGIAVCRNQISKSLDIVHFINHLERKGFFELVIKRLEATPPAPIEVTIELVSIVAHVCRLFHREYALSYLPRLTDSLVRYLLSSPDSNIRNFSKQRLDTLFLSFDEFFSRCLSLPQKRTKKYELQPRLARMFIDSQFLDRKLNSLAIMTDLIRQARLEDDPSALLETIEKWIVENRIIEKLYQEGTHPELISRSSDLLKLHLNFKPTLKSLEPLLELNEPILKLIVDNIQYFPIEFLKQVGDRIVAKELPLDATTLAIVKVVGGYEKWLLSKGGMGWVDVVKEKRNRGQDILQLLNHPFPLVSKIFLEIIRIEYKFIQVFLKYACEIDYAQKVLDDPTIETFKKVEFLRPYFKYVTRVDEHGIDQIDALWEQVMTSSNPSKQLFDTYMLLLEQVEPNQTENFFNKHFTKVEDLRRVTVWSFNIFVKLVASLNDKLDDSEANKVGMSELIVMIFENENLAVTKRALELMSHLMDKFDKEETGALKEGFLEKCLARLYEGANYEKYLSILSSILNESEKAGNGNLNPVSRQLPPEKMHITFINHFNELRNKLHLTVNSNLTLYELRHEMGRLVNAYGHELKMYCGEKLLDEHWNALSIDSLPLDNTISISKRHKIERAELTTAGKLTDDANKIFKMVFDEYSTNGLMSKNDCKRLQKRMVGDSMIFVESKVNKIFQNYDADKDDHLKFSEFVSHYEMLAKVKPNSVWTGLEALGVREDLRLLGDVPLTQPEPTELPRYFLVHNDRFMGLLFDLLSVEGSVAQCSWSMLMRLPIYANRKEFDKANKYQLRYWLYLLDAKQLVQSLNNDDLQKVLASDDQTLAIGLKVAEEQHLELSAQNFSTLLRRIETINGESKLNKYSRIVLKFSLMMVSRAVDSQPLLKEEFLKDNARFERLFVTGLMSSKPELRNIYIEAVAQMFVHFTRQPDLFSMFFSIVYINFEKCNKKDLSPEYFSLFSGALEEARTNNLLQQLGGHNILDTVVKVFQEHQSAEKSLSSAEDHVAIGFMNLIGTLLTGDYLPKGFVGYLFNECLFPQHGDKSHELKSTNSRKVAYELIFRLCQTDASQLDELFQAGFKKIYKSISHVKLSYYYKEFRSEYGYAGIHNLGCICYMIAMLQQFFLTKPFRYLVLMADDGVEENLVKHASREIDDNLFHQLQTMFANLELTERQEYNPEDFCFAFKDFDGNPVNVGVQQDAQQFLNMLFDKVEQSLKPTPFRHLADNIYGGRYCNQFVCSSCKHVIERHENFFSLSLEVKGQKTIQDSFKKFITGQVISDYKCDNCDKKCDTAKRCFISGLPNYLILYLQRICFNYDKFENEKINTRWEFPHQLNLFDYTLEKEKGLENSNDYDYALKGIVVHIGSAEFGHYFSYIKTPEGSWLEYNDERVREFDPKDIEQEAYGGGIGWRKDNQSAYLLLYEKVHKKPFALEFISEDEKRQVLARFGLSEIAQQAPASILGDSPSGAREEKLEKQEEETESQPAAIVSVSPKPIIANINLSDVQQFVPEKARTRIDKANEDFTLQIQVSSSEFMEFLYKVSTIDPPAHLKNEFLELCYECFPLKQTIGDTHVSICDEMPKRFNELIRGCGWYFFETQSNNWNKELFNMEKTIRVGTKRLIVSVLSDIFETYPPTAKEQAEETQEELHLVEDGEIVEPTGTVEQATGDTEPEPQIVAKKDDVVEVIAQEPESSPSEPRVVQPEQEKAEQVAGVEIMDTADIPDNPSDSNAPEASDEAEISDVPEASDVPDAAEADVETAKKPMRRCDSNNSKLEMVYEYLATLVGLMKEEVQDGWLRMQEYFELWIDLIKICPQIREFLSDQKMTELLLDYLLEDSSPLKLIPNRRKYGVRHYTFNFEQAFELLFELISEEKTFSENELKCFVSYVFLEKLVKAVSKKPGFISNICRNNSVVSERVAYCISEGLMKVTHSDDSKPLIESIIEYINIKDDLTDQRKEWIIGMPQLEYHPKTMSYGMYALPTVLDIVYGFYSPLGISPVLYIINYMREKYEHVTVLLTSMILQLEQDGLLNLNSYPSNLPLERNYTSWMERQVDQYYEQMVNPKGGQKIPDNYKGYATRLHNLWYGRPELPHPQRYLIGKTISEKEIRCTDLPKYNLKIMEFELTSYIAPAEFEYNGQLKHSKKFLHRSSSTYFATDPDLIDSCPNAEFFLRRGVTSNVMDEPLRHEGESPFDNAFKCDYIRKITLKNEGSELLVLIKFVSSGDVNSLLPISPVRFLMRPMSEVTMVITKQLAEQPWGKYELEVDAVPQSGSLRLKDYPQQLITPYSGEQQVPSDAEDDDSFTGYYTG